ncbi:hypothetical protein EVAR_89804_1 [Eumeta japonica]|uniref:Uncharacterized protein n=1 Tax=Eumeta variegata TaxID=151549 RepID=A0A4C1SI24_EUMVA|nr:hypothetical protein EVAR_89804_1 [Eumeta japonica]
MPSGKKSSLATTISLQGNCPIEPASDSSPRRPRSTLSTTNVLILLIRVYVIKNTIKTPDLSFYKQFRILSNDRSKDNSTENTKNASLRRLRRTRAALAPVCAAPNAPR